MLKNRFFYVPWFNFLYNHSYNLNLNRMFYFKKTPYYLYPVSAANGIIAEKVVQQSNVDDDNTKHEVSSSILKEVSEQTVTPPTISPEPILQVTEKITTEVPANSEFLHEFALGLILVGTGIVLAVCGYHFYKYLSSAPDSTTTSSNVTPSVPPNNLTINTDTNAIPDIQQLQTLKYSNYTYDQTVLESTLKKNINMLESDMIRANNKILEVAFKVENELLETYRNSAHNVVLDDSAIKMLKGTSGFPGNHLSINQTPFNLYESRNYFKFKNNKIDWKYEDVMKSKYMNKKIEKLLSGYDDHDFLKFNEDINRLIAPLNSDNAQAVLNSDIIMHAQRMGVYQFTEVVDSILSSSDCMAAITQIFGIY